MHPFTKFKQEQNKLAADIRILKTFRKRDYFASNDLPQHLKCCSNLRAAELAVSMGSDFRHRHIAYCELRGRVRGEIERVVSGHNPVLEGLVTRHKDSLGDELAEYTAAWAEAHPPKKAEASELEEAAHAG